MSFRHRASIVALAALVLFASTAFSSTAFTSGTLERDATVTVEADDTALVSLIDGHPDNGLIEQSSTGTLRIDFGLGGGSGPNENARFTFGSTSSPASNHAFRIVNRGPHGHDLTLSFTLTGDDGGDSTANVEFTFYLDRGTDGVDTSATTSEEGTDVTFTSVDSADTVYAVVEVDAVGLSSSADLSGELAVSAGN